MKRKRIIAISIFLLCVAPLGFIGTRYERLADVAILTAYVVAFLLMIIYKMRLTIKYRNEPAKREAVLNSGQLFPPKLMRFIFDEDKLSSKPAPHHPPSS